ncbi:MAG TPA: transcription elongation factor GreA [Gammaproteobacteria bacterium]|nr:transcription elongation factor GreA [Gammaproteobacteria bacterium]
MQKSPMTAEGAQKLREELQRLKFVERPRITNAIAEARALGDLKENAEYHAAREQQSFTEGRIAEIEGKLATAEIIDVTKVNAQGRVVFGATVELMNLGSDEEVKYRIVGEDEADIKAGLVSINSPVARALIGKREGDTVTVQVPSGAVEYEILAVHYV